MMTLPKMTAEECSIPVGNECPYPSQLEAEQFSAKLPIHSSYTRLMLLISEENQNYFCWCGFNETAQIRLFYPLFKDDKVPTAPPPKGRPLQEGEYLKYGNDFYIICMDKKLGITVKQIAVFSTAQDAGAAWHMQTMTPQTTADNEPDYFLVQIFRVSQPNEPVCVCWYINPPEDNIRMLPVFWEDQEKFTEIPPSDRNWSYLKEGDIFTHDNKTYRVCLDEIEDYYIAPTPLQICVKNP